MNVPTGQHQKHSATHYIEKKTESVKAPKGHNSGEIMPQSLSKIYSHIVFSTKNRANIIDKKIEGELYNYIGGVCKSLECNPVIVGGYRNHVHILCLLSRKVAAMNLIQEIKQSSSKWIKTKGTQYSDFYWQDGYGVFSVSQSHVEKVTSYISNQEIHHQKRDFKKEFIVLLRRYKVEYDERYLWG